MNVVNEARSCLDAYEKGHIPLDRLVARLEQLQGLAGSQPEGWHNNFFREWMALEEVNALTLDEGRTDKSLTQEELTVVRDAIRGLRVLLSV